MQQIERFICSGKRDGTNDSLIGTMLAVAVIFCPAQHLPTASSRIWEVIEFEVVLEVIPSLEVTQC